MAHAEQLTPALEDYLETVYLLVERNKVARVRDIASERGVRPGSVSPAMKRLSEMGLVQYAQREYVDLTPEGLIAARRVLARHRVLHRFFRKVLQLPEELAESEACAMEHSLSSETMDRMVSLFEFVDACPRGQNDFLDRFHQCPIVNEDCDECEHGCDRSGGSALGDQPLSGMEAGERATVTRIGSHGAVRQRLLNMGMLPGTEVTVERFAPRGDPVWIRMGASQIALRRHEADALMVRVLPLEDEQDHEISDR
jgi:DtxR family transcriptional regulator, Mn-dependent transcriptional regulator